MKVVLISNQDWQQYSENANLICFNEIGYSKLEMCDYALVVEKDGVPLTYSTIKIMDSQTAYMQRGGSFPSAKDTILSFRAYEMTINHLKNTYKNLITRIENKNFAMLKFAMKVGFVISGLSVDKDKIYLEHHLEVL